MAEGITAKRVRDWVRENPNLGAPLYAREAWITPLVK